MAKTTSGHHPTCSSMTTATADAPPATAATNHNPRHPMVTARAVLTLDRVSGGRVTLGLNLKEAQQVFTTLSFGTETESESGLPSS